MKEDSIPLFFGIIAFMTAIALAILPYFIRRHKDRERLKSFTEIASSCIPPGTFLAYPDDVLQIVEHLLQHNSKAHYGSKTEVLRVLKEAVNNGQDPKIQFQHILNVLNTTKPSL